MGIYFILAVIIIIAIAYILIDGIKDYLSATTKIDEAIDIYCTDCDKIFYSIDSMKTAVGIYPCPYCASRNTRLDTLKSQIAEPVNDKLYCCDCDRTFHSDQSVKTAVGIYPCPYCASNHTCLDTLKKENINYQSQTPL